MAIPNPGELRARQLAYNAALREEVKRLKWGSKPATHHDLAAEGGPPPSPKGSCKRRRAK